MALFERQGIIKAGSRSNTKLVVSGGNSPAETWITDLSLPILFRNDYAGPAEKEVVVGKGMVLAVGDQTFDDETGKKVNTLTIADSAVSAKATAVGVAPYNFSKHYPNFLYGNRPSIITREYIELPLFSGTGAGSSAAVNAAALKYGAAFGELKAGDFVKVAGGDNKGQLTKWVAGTDSTHLILGQILATDINQEPFGWLKWALWDEAARMMDRGPLAGADQTRLGANGAANNNVNNSDGTTKYTDSDGFPYDAAYRNSLGDSSLPGYLNPYTTNPTGIPGILDGSQRAQTTHGYAATVAAGTSSAVPFKIQLPHNNIVNIPVTTVQIYVGTDSNGTLLTEGTDYTVDYAKGIVYYKKTTSSNTAVFVQYRANFWGTPAGWDYRGSVGAARILLKF